MSREQQTTQAVAQQVLRELRERNRVAAVQRRQATDDLQRLEAEAALIGDDLVAEGLAPGSEAYFTALLRMLAERHLGAGRDPLESSPLWRFPYD